MKTLPLTKGLVALVDDADFLEIGDLKWTARGTAKTGIYACRNDQVGGKQKEYALHRVLFGCPSVEVDHINGNKLDNQRHNLRLASHLQNSRNAGKRKKNATSRWKGVGWHKKNKCWQARIRPGAGLKEIQFNGFKSELEAADAYDTAALKFHGEFANLNFPTER